MKGMVRRAVSTTVVALAMAGGLAADTLYLRDGSRIDGELVRVEGGRVEFRERGTRLLRFDLDEVRSIEFDRRGGDWGRPSGDRPSGDRRPGMREREVVVSADVPFVDTGIDVRAGQSVYFEARGRVRWGRDRQDGPDGERNSPHNPGRPMPNRPAAALIGTIGDRSGDIFFIGDDPGAFRIRTSGRLFLGINDDVLTDNSGNFRVVVFY